MHSAPHIFFLLRTRAVLLACVFGLCFSVSTVQAQGDDLLPATRGAERPSASSRLKEPEDPETLYNRGLRQLRRGYYDEAIISFEKVKNHFPFNQYSVLCELRVADALFEKDSYLEAIDAYRQFTRLHPRHSEIDYATYRMARAEFKVSSSVPQRDQTSTERGLKKLLGFEKRFPDSEYTEEVVRIRGKARARLAKRVLQVGNFYWKGREWKAAERRYGIVWASYSDTAVIYKARYRQGLCLLELARHDEALVVLTDLAGRSDAGRWGERAQRVLDRGVKTAQGVVSDTVPASPVVDSDEAVSQEPEATGPAEGTEDETTSQEPAGEEKLSTGS